MANGLIRVLVIDDSAYNRVTISRLLQSHDSIRVVATAVDGEDGIKQLIRHKPDVVTLDLEMPVMSGIEATRQILALDDPPPIVIVSGSKSSDALDQALAAGARWHVEKRDATTALAPAIRAAAAAPRVGRKPP